MIQKLNPADCEPACGNRAIRDSDLSDLLEDIRRNGQLVPGIAAPHPDKPGRYVVAAGNRRCRCCALLGLPFLAEVRDKPFAPGEAIRISVSENLKRKNPDAFELCESIGLYKREMKLATWEEVAESLGLSPATVSRIRGVNRYPESMRPLTEGLGSTVVQLIGKLPSIDKMQAALEFAHDAGDGKPASKEQLERFIRKQKDEGKDRKPRLLKGTLGGRKVAIHVHKGESADKLAEALEELAKRLRKHAGVEASKLDFLLR